MDNEFITNEIKNRKVIYYLTTKNDLDAIKSKSILADIFLTLFSVFLGIVFTIMITRESIKNLSPDLIIKFNIYFYVFSIVSAICFLFFIFYCCQHFRTIKEIILSGGHSSEDNALKAVKSLKIIEAVYFSENWSKDVKEKLQNMILDNLLTGTANNELFGDPDHGKDKWLKIKFSVDGKQFEKQYNQGEAFQLPPNEPMKK